MLQRQRSRQNNQKIGKYRLCGCSLLVCLIRCLSDYLSVRVFSVCLSVCLPVCLSGWSSGCLFASLPDYLTGCLSICRSLCISIFCLHTSICLSSGCQPILHSVYLFVCLFDFSRVVNPSFNHNLPSHCHCPLLVIQTHRRMDWTTSMRCSIKVGCIPRLTWPKCSRNCPTDAEDSSPSPRRKAEELPPLERRSWTKKDINCRPGKWYV